MVGLVYVREFMIFYNLCFVYNENFIVGEVIVIFMEFFL